MAAVPLSMQRRADDHRNRSLTCESTEAATSQNKDRGLHEEAAIID